MDERPATANAEHVSELAVVAAVNDFAVLRQNLASSPMIAEGRVRLIVESGHRSAASAYNAGMLQAAESLVVFAHQDIYFPRGWDERFLGAIAAIPRDEWGVVGVFGLDERGMPAGRAWDPGVGVIGESASAPVPVVTLDEIVLIVRADSGLTFDEGLPGFHLYGTDIVQASLKAGFAAYAVDAPVIHNALATFWLDSDYRAGYRYLREKWRSRLPLPTTIVPVATSDWPMIDFCLRSLSARTLGRRRAHKRYSASLVALARELGFAS